MAARSALARLAPALTRPRALPSVARRLELARGYATESEHQVWRVTEWSFYFELSLTFVRNVDDRS